MRRSNTVATLLSAAMAATLIGCLSTDAVDEENEDLSASAAKTSCAFQPLQVKVGVKQTVKVLNTALTTGKYHVKVNPNIEGQPPRVYPMSGGIYFFFTPGASGPGSVQVYETNSNTLKAQCSFEVKGRGTSEPVDQCPSDPNKTEPGNCGCNKLESACKGSSVTCKLNPYSSVSWSTWNQYKANFHTHTTNSDGALSPSSVISQYEKANYDILAITDHDFITSWTAPSGMLKVKGDEYSVSEHVNALFNFSRAASDLQNGIPHIATQRGMCQINHPGRESYPASWYIPWFRDYTCFGLEVFNQGDRYSSDRKLWDKINESFFVTNRKLVWGTSNDDMHETEHLFGNFQFVLMPSLVESNLRTSLQNGAFYFAYEPGGSGGARVPRISGITVNNAAKTIAITATGANRISWIGPGTASVAAGSTFNFSKYTKPFVRAVLYGSSGDSYTQPFGFVSE